MGLAPRVARAGITDARGACGSTFQADTVCDRVNQRHARVAALLRRASRCTLDALLAQPEWIDLDGPLDTRERPFMPADTLYEASAGWGDWDAGYIGPGLVAGRAGCGASRERRGNGVAAWW